MKSSSTDSSEARLWTRYLAVLLGGLLAAGVVAEILLRSFIVPIIDSRANRVDRIYHAENPDVVLGDSHLYRSFLRSERFENLARPGSSPAALEIVAREYFRRLDPGRVILQASPQLFTALMEREGAQQHDEWFFLNLGLPFVPYLFEPGIARELAAFADWPGLRRRHEVALGRRVLDGPFVQREAAARRALPDDERFGEARKRVRQNRPQADFRSREPFAAYRRLVEFLLARGARLCLVATPVDAAYQTLAHEEPRHGEALRALRALAAEHDVPFVDFRDLDLQLEVDDFTNADHLTTRAGTRYAERVETACFGAGGSSGSSSPTR